MKWILKQFIAAIIAAIKDFLAEKADKHPANSQSANHESEQTQRVEDTPLQHTPEVYGVSLGPPLSTYQKRDKAAAEKYLNGI